MIDSFVFCGQKVRNDEEVARKPFLLHLLTEINVTILNKIVLGGGIL